MSKKKNKFDFKQFLKDFSQLSTAKKEQSLAVKLAIGLAALTVALCLMFASRTIHSAMGTIAVVDTGGQFLPVVIENQDHLYKTLLTTHCYSTTYYVNSFDRNSIKTNQAKAYFLADASDLNSIFSGYNNKKYYADAINRGVVYRCEFVELNQVQSIGNGSEYRVVFTSLLSVIDGAKITRFTITSRGTAIRVTPTFPENPTGFYFKEYTQDYQSLTE